MEKERIQKLLSQAGVSSRRAAEQLIRNNRITINGRIAQIGESASFDDVICIDNKKIESQKKEYWLLNKPSSYICTKRDPQGRRTVMELIKTRNRIFPVGRLDFMTTGVLLLTNDGEFTNRLLHPSFEIKRVYKAVVDEELTRENMDEINSDHFSIEGRLSSQKIRKIGAKTYEIEMHEGWNHHVKKIFKVFSRRVVTLERISFAGITCEGLRYGESRMLTPLEVEKLLK